MVALPYMTRTTAAAVLTKIKTEVFGLEESSSLGAAFQVAGIVNVLDILALSHEQIDSLNYFPCAEAGSTARPAAVPINIGNRNLIRLFQSWIQQKIAGSDNEPLDLIWNDLTQQDFVVYCISTGATILTADIPLALRSCSSIAGAYGDSDFKQGICRDTNAYPVLKGNKYFNNRNCSVISQARAHDVTYIFDTGYTPKTEEEKQLLKAKQEFVYSMFNQCVQTNTGKLIVRFHEVNFDAQAVYSKLVPTAKKSTKAQLIRDKLVTELTTNKPDSSWKGTHEGFVLMWKEKISLLEEISPQSNHYSTEVELSMLQNAVSIVPKLSSIRDISDNLVAIGNNL